MNLRRPPKQMIGCWSKRSTDYGGETHPPEEARERDSLQLSSNEEDVMETLAEPRQAPGLPRLRQPAPDFEAPTTHGLKKLSDYRGKWLVLFSHPADFTPVCTTEFIAFAKAYEQFRALNCELLGLSIDSNFSHIAWERNINEKFGVEIPFPIIADLSMEVARAYGMIQPGESDTSAVRATFVIDPDGKLRPMVYYPMSNGRSIPELLRLGKAIQTATSMVWPRLRAGSPAIV